jgi:Big-like domain-containing protein
MQPSSNGRGRRFVRHHSRHEGHCLNITRRVTGIRLLIVVVVTVLWALALPAGLREPRPARAVEGAGVPAARSVRAGMEARAARPSHPPSPRRVSPQAEHRADADEPGADSPDGALNFRRLQQQDETGYVPQDGLIRAKRHVDQMRRSQEVTRPGADRSAAGLSPASWTWLGPGNIGGRVRSIVVNPVAPSTWFAGGVSGGVWRTVDSGGHWEPVNDFLANLSISTMVIQPGNPLVMYAGTGEAVQGLQGAGIFKSTDGGETWAQLASTASGEAFNYVNRLAMSPDGSVLLAATTMGIHRSTDGGATFTLVLDTFYNPDFDRPMYVAFNPANGSKAIASAYDGKGWYSNDAGQTWTASTGLPVLPSGSRRVELAYAPSNPAIVYASVDEAGGTIYKSTNGGVAYSFVSTGVNYFRSPPNNQGWYDNAIWVDPTNSSTLIVGGVGLFKSTNGGTTLSDITGTVHVDFHAIVSMPGYNGSTNRQVLVGNDGGVYFINDVAAAPAGWVSKNNNLGVTQFYGAAGNDSSGTIVGGTQDNGTLRFTIPGGSQAYTSMAGGDGGYAAADPTDPNYFYGEFQWLSVHRSSNGGASSNMFFNNAIPDSNGNSNFIAPFILDPNNSSTLLAAGASLWRSTDAKFGNPPTFASIKAPTGSFVSAIAIAAGNSDICWVGHNNGHVYKAIDCMAAAPTWTQVDTNSPGLPNRMVMRLTLDPSDPSGNRVYATFGGFSPENVWRTANGGASWSSVSGAGATALPAAPVHDLEFHPSTPSWLYAATEIGVFTSVDAGATWQVPQDGPANVIVSELFWMGSDLVAATFGRGLFKATVIDGTDVTPPTVTLISPANGATDVSSGTSVTATFGEAIDPATLTTSTFVLRNPANGVVPATISYNAVTGVAMLTLSAALASSTTYTTTVTGGSAGVKDAAGNPLASSVVWSFTTVLSDTTPPTVSGMTPANGATGVGTGTAVTATFSEAINASTLTTSTFMLRNSANAVVPATLSYNAGTGVGRLTPSGALAASTAYTATITGGTAGVKDVAGNPLTANSVWSFTTTSAPVTVGLTTVGTSLDTWDSNYLNGSKVTTTAAGQITSMSVYVGAIDSVVANRQYRLAVYADSAGQPGALIAVSAAGTLTANAWNTLAVTASLAGSTNYWLMFNTNGRTASVNNMYYNSGAAGQGAYSTGSVSFGTWPATFPAVTTTTFVYSLFATFGTDTTPPTVTSVTPANGATGLSTATAVTATFSEAINAATLTTSTFVLRNPADVVVPATVSYDTGTRVTTLRPSGALATSTNYTATITSGSAGVKDAAGNTLAGNFVWSFTTVLADTTPPTVSGATPASGATGVSRGTRVTATFSEAINAATLTTSTFVLRNPSSAVVPATATYNAGTRVATLTPLAALTALTTYTATITGGGSGVTDVAGNPLASNFVSSFTTTNTIVTVGLTTIGSFLDSGDSNYLNGSKVTTTAAGQISSMSVYVGAIDSVVANRQYQLAVYTDNAGRPGTRVVASATGTLVANAWNTLAISTPLLGNTSYWLMFNTNGRTGTVNNMRYNTGPAGQGAYSTGSAPFGTWPATFPAATTTNFVCSLFATFDP